MGILNRKNSGRDELDNPLEMVPLDKRESWISPAVVYAGVEFCLAVIMTGALLAGSFNIVEISLILAIAFGITWVGDSVQAYIGAKTGRPSTVIAKQAFGSLQARTVIALAVIIMGLGWWGIQTAVMGNAITAALGIDYTANWGIWAAITIVLGLIFAIPAILGYTSIKWTDYVAIPIGLFIFGLGAYLSIRSHGWSGIVGWNPPHDMKWTAAISLIIGVNVCQWVMISDYSRLVKPTVKNAVLVPSLTMIVGFGLMLVGAIMAVGVGTSDIIAVMVVLGYPFWAYFLMFIAQWTTQIINVYTPGLGVSNMFNLKSGRAMATLGITVIGIILALAGILDMFEDFLGLLAIIYPAIGAIIITDFFMRDNWKEIDGWNWIATLALVIGLVAGYLMQYTYQIGIPPVQTFFITSAIYYVLMKAKAAKSPDKFTPKGWLPEG